MLLAPKLLNTQQLKNLIARAKASPTSIVAGVTDVEAGEIILRAIRAEIAATLQISEDEIDNKDSLFDLGINSLMAVQLVMNVERRLLVNIRSTSSAAENTGASVDGGLSFIFDNMFATNENDVLMREPKTNSIDYKIYDYLADRGVDENMRQTLVSKFKLDIARATRPKWVDRVKRGGDLAMLSAPSFLRRVHADEFNSDGSVSKDIIRSIDPELIKAVDTYIGQRNARKLDLGDAKGLIFVSARATPRRPKDTRRGAAPQAGTRM